MRGNGIIISRAVMVAAISAILIADANTAYAQSADTWSLPEPTATPSAPRAQGPVDGQNPVVRPSSEPAQSPSPVPVRPTPGPVVTLRPAPPPPASTAPTPRPSATPSPAPSSSAVAAPSPEQEPVGAALPDRAAAPEPAPAAEVPAQTAPIEAASAETSDGAANDWPAWWWAVPLALLALAGAFVVFLRRRRTGLDGSNPGALEDITPSAADNPPAPDPAPVVRDAPVKPAPFAPRSTFAPPEMPPAMDAVEIAFEPAGLRLSLVYATLQYRLSFTAIADMPPGHLLGDMIGAHASIPTEQQLAPGLETLTRLKAVPPIAAGESVTLKGELQLPLSAIRPLQQGNASFFVPLVRLCLVGEDGGLVERRVFTVGLDGAATALAPLRLDTGPQEHRQLAAREVDAARGYPLHPDQRLVAG